MEIPKSRVVLLGALLLASCVHARGADSADWSNLRSLKPDQKLTVTHVNGRKEKGNFRGFSEQSITIHTRTGDVAVSRADVQKISAGSGLKRLRNTFIGMGAGAGAGAVIATKTAARDHRAEALAAALFSLAVGTVCGAVMPARNTIYEAKPAGTRTTVSQARLRDSRLRR